MDVPAKVIWGARDPLFPPEFADQVTELLPGASVQVLDDVGHFTPIEAPAEMAEAVRGFL